MSDEDAVYEMTIDQPSRPKGEPLQIAGLGTFDNGYTYTISREEADAFRTYNTQLVPVEREDAAVVDVDTELGLTLLQAADGMYGVTVKTFDKNAKKDPNVRSNRHHATTTADDDTSEPNPGSALAESETPTMEVVSTDPQPKTKNKGGDS